MKKWTSFVTSLYILYSAGLAAQSSILFEGNDKTESKFLEQFIIPVEPNNDLNQEILEDNIQQLKNLPSVKFAEVQLDTNENQIKAIYRIEERRTLLPIVDFGGIRDNFWFRLGATDINFLGKGHTFLAYYQNTDQRHSAQVYYRNPRIKFSSWGYAINANKWASLEPVFFENSTVQYLYDNNSLALSLIKNFGIDRVVELTGNIFQEHYAKDPKLDFPGSPGPDDVDRLKWLIKYRYHEDFRDYHYFLLSGFDWSLECQHVYSTNDQNWFNSLRLEGRYFFRPKKKLNVAMRLRFAIASNMETPFAPFVVDSYVNIRGVGNTIDRGTGQIVFNAELRHTIWDKEDWASQFIMFSDFGTWRRAGNSFEDFLDNEIMQYFVGTGFRLIFKKYYSGILRIDYGIDVFDFKKRGIVFGLGQYF